MIGVEKNASTDEIRRAYKKKALKMHPNKGGDPEKVIFCLEIFFLNFFHYKSSKSSHMPMKSYQIPKKEIFMIVVESRQLITVECQAQV